MPIAIPGAMVAMAGAVVMVVVMGAGRVVTAVVPPTPAAAPAPPPAAPPPLTTVWRRPGRGESREGREESRGEERVMGRQRRMDQATIWNMKSERE